MVLSNKIGEWFMYKFRETSVIYPVLFNLIVNETELLLCDEADGKLHNEILVGCKMEVDLERDLNIGMAKVMPYLLNRCWSGNYTKYRLNVDEDIWGQGNFL